MRAVEKVTGRPRHHSTAPMKYVTGTADLRSKDSRSRPSRRHDEENSHYCRRARDDQLYGSGAKLPEQANHPAGSVRRRRTDRYGCACDGPIDVEANWATDHHRERIGRRRHDRGDTGLTRGARWLHCAHSPHRHGDGSHAVPQAGLRYENCIRSYWSRDQCPDDGHRTPRFAAEHAGRAGRLHQDEWRQDDLRQCGIGGRFPSLRHAVHEGGRQANSRGAL